MLSQSELQELVELHYRKIYAFCLSQIKDSDDAKDITQDVFVMLCERTDELENENLRAWLYGVAAKKIFSYKRNKQKQGNIVEISDMVCSVGSFEEFFDSDGNYMDDDAIISKAAEIIDKLSEKDKLLYKRVYIDKAPYSELRDEMGVSGKVLSAKIFHLRERIKKIIAATMCFLGIFSI